MLQCSHSEFGHPRLLRGWCLIHTAQLVGSRDSHMVSAAQCTPCSPNGGEHSDVMNAVPRFSPVAILGTLCCLQVRIQPCMLPNTLSTMLGRSSPHP